MLPLIDGDIGKVCNKCKVFKILEDFPPNKQCKLGVTGTCRSCYNKNTSLWYNTNRIRRQEAANKRNQTRKSLVVKHFGGICHDCKGTYPQCVYEFHHLDSSQKDVNPSKAMSWAEERMWKELDKCIMLCSNCHKIRHFSLGESEDRDVTID